MFCIKFQYLTWKKDDLERLCDEFVWLRRQKIKLLNCVLLLRVLLILIVQIRALYRKSKIITRFSSGSISPTFGRHVFVVVMARQSHVFLSTRSVGLLSTLVLSSVYSSQVWGVSPLNIRAFEIKKLLVTLRYSKLNNAVA